MDIKIPVVPQFGTRECRRSICMLCYNLHTRCKKETETKTLEHGWYLTLIFYTALENAMKSGLF